MSPFPVITAAKRTPIGSLQGQLSLYRSPDLAACIIKDILEQAPALVETIEEVILGCVLSAGLGQAPARQAMLQGGLSKHINATTVNKVCGSGMKAVMMACDMIRLNQARSILAGGMESMSNAPYLLQKARGGYRFGHGVCLDHMVWDGLEDASSPALDGSRTPMGFFAEKTAEKYGFTRAQQEKFAIETFDFFQKALGSGAFSDEITSLLSKDNMISADEPPTKVKIEKFEKLKPAFQKDGTVTAATSSSIADGAAVLCVENESTARDSGRPVLARIVDYVSAAREPEWFTLAPILAIEKILRKVGWSMHDVDLFEINEAFAVVPMAAMHDLKIPREKVNVHGGACALGHPIGASGARILVTLIHALRHHNLKRGIATACIGGGEATAIAIEIP